mgnify:FL=1
MININFLFPWEKRRIKDEIAKKIMDKYNKKVVKYEFHHVGEEKVFL